MELMEIYESYEDVNPVMEPKIRLNKAAQRDFLDYIEREELLLLSFLLYNRFANIVCYFFGGMRFYYGRY